MEKQEYIRSIKLLLLASVAAVTIVVGAIISASAQGKPKFKVGDRIEVETLMSSQPEKSGIWRKGTVTKLNDPESPYGTYSIKIDGRDTEVTYSFRNTQWFRALNEPDKNADDNAPNDHNQKREPDKKEQKRETEKTNERSIFTVGDRVSVSIGGLKGDKYYQPCTITSGLKNNTYGVRCDPHNTLSYKDYYVQPEWIRASNDATHPPKFDCSFDTPAGIISRTAGPSAQLFQRVIYERMAAVEKAKLGLGFMTFQIGSPYRNSLTQNGLLVASAAQNALIYPVKTQYRTCTEGTLEFDFLVVTKETFACFKDRFGDWVCTDGPTDVLEHQSVPKDQKKDR